MLRLKKNNIEKQICAQRSKVNTHRDSNILFEHRISDSKTRMFDKERNSLDKFFSVKYLLPKPL